VRFCYFAKSSFIRFISLSFNHLYAVRTSHAPATHPPAAAAPPPRPPCRLAALAALWPCCGRRLAARRWWLHPRRLTVHTAVSCTRGCGMLAHGPALPLTVLLLALLVVAKAEQQQQQRAAPTTKKLRIMYHPAGKALSPIDEPWALTYQYTVPAHKPGKEWDPKAGVFFIWGDTDFDSYGPRNATLRIHDYIFNQIVPQLVIGNTLAANDDKYNPGWYVFDEWKIQAQYFWERRPKEDGGWAPYSLGRSMPPHGNDLVGAPPRMGTNCEGNGTIFCALCGDVVPVQAGDLITTVISYDGRGKMDASISATAPDDGGGGGGGVRGVSTISIPRPFP
jgi:hypothetical protein